MDIEAKAKAAYDAYRNAEVFAGIDFPDLEDQIFPIQLAWVQVARAVLGGV